MMNRSIAHPVAALFALAPCAACSAPPHELPTRAATHATALTQTAQAESARQRHAALRSMPFMLSPFGAMVPPAPDALPSDPSVRTRAGLYLTRREAAQMDMLLGGDTVWIEPGCEGDAALAQAHGIVDGLRAAQDLSADAPVFVSGPDAHQSMRLADRLGAAGLTRVFLITR